MDKIRILHLHLKGFYFHQIRLGNKKEEYRLYDKWRDKLLLKDYDQIHIYLGYPGRGEYNTKRIIRKWNGSTIKHITHPHFGDERVKVFAINVEQPLL